jgi:hypothetical protein
MMKEGDKVYYHDPEVCQFGEGHVSASPYLHEGTWYVNVTLDEGEIVDFLPVDTVFVDR